jgi:hypothetical protein
VGVERGRRVVVDRRRTVLLTLALALLLCLSGPNVTNNDSYLVVPTAWSVLREHDLDLDEYDAPLVRAHHGFDEVAGHHVEFYPWPVSLVAVPVLAAVAAGDALGIVDGPTELIATNRMDPIQLAAAAVVVAATAAVVALTALERCPRRSRATAVAFALVVVATTSLWSTASRALWQHGPAALFLALGLLVAQRLVVGAPLLTARRTVALGAWLALACLMRPTAAVAAGCLVAAVGWTALRSSPGRLAQLTAGVGAGAAVVAVPFALVNLAAFGTVLPDAYGANRLAIHGHYGEALLANLVSPARGLFVYTPVLLVALVDLVARWRRGSPPGVLAVACLAAVVVHWLVVSAGSYGWWAGHSYGPRFFAELSPLVAYLLLPLVERLRRPGLAWRTVIIAASVAAVAIHAPGVYLRSTNCWNTDPVDVDRHPERVWSWSDPPFLHAALAAAHGLPPRQVVLGPCPPIPA